MKTCRKCSQSKPISAFPKNERYAGGYGTWCKECHRLANREWYLSNADDPLVLSGISDHTFALDERAKRKESACGIKGKLWEAK